MFDPTWPKYSTPYTLDNIPIPPPPPREKGPRKDWIIACVLAAVIIVSASIAVGIKLTNILPATSVTPTPSIKLTKTLSIASVTPTPLYVNGLSSTNFNIFVNAFADALQEQDVASIEPHTDTLHFFISCDAGKYYQGTCDSTWPELKQQIATDKVELSIPHYATLGSQPTITCPDLSAPGNASVIAGTYDNKAFILPLPHYGKAFFFFACVSCGSESTWGWEGVYSC